MAKKDELTRIVTQDNFVTEKIDVIENNLLGNYDDEGNYFIPPQIVKELILLKKVKKSTFGNSVFCVGNLLGYGELVFELLFDSKTHNGKSASSTLYILEDVDKINGYLQNTIKTRLDDFNDSVENFIKESYDYFNIDVDDDDDDDDDDSEVLERKLKDDIYNEDSFIIAKKQYSLTLEKLLEDKFLDAYGKYFTSRISLLTKLNNDFSQAILDSFYKQYAMINNVFLQEQNYKKLNELLDKCFEEKSGTSAQFVLQEKEYSKLIQPSLDNFVDSVNKLNDKYEKKALNMLDKSDRKKVEEMLEEDQKDHEDKHPERESKQDVNQIVNEVPKNVYTHEALENQKESKKKEELEVEDHHFIEDIKNTNKAKENEIKEKLEEKQLHQENHKEKQTEQKPEKEEKQQENEVQEKQQEKQQEEQHKEVEEQNFYDTFKKNHEEMINEENVKEETTPAYNVGVHSDKVIDTSRSNLDNDQNERREESAINSLKDRMERLEKFKGDSVKEKPRPQQPSSVQSFYDTLTREKQIKEQQIDVNNRRNRQAIDSMDFSEMEK